MLLPLHASYSLSLFSLLFSLSSLLLCHGVAFLVSVTDRHSVPPSVNHVCCSSLDTCMALPFLAMGEQPLYGAPARILKRNDGVATQLRCTRALYFNVYHLELWFGFVTTTMCAL